MLYNYYIAGRLFSHNSSVVRVSTSPHFTSAEEAAAFYEHNKQYDVHYKWSRYKNLCIMRTPIVDPEIVQMLS